MFNSLKQWLNNIPVDNPVQRQQAILIQLLLMGAIAILLIALLFLPFVEVPLDVKLLNLRVNFIAVAIIAIPLFLIRRGYSQQAAFLVTIIATIAMAYSVIVQGITAYNILLFTLPITLAGLVLGRAFLLVAVGLTSALVVFGTLNSSPPLTDTDALGQIVTFLLLLSLLGVFLDRFGIVLREALEEANQSREELQAKIAERTAELAAKNLELEKLARIKEEFVANVSHELRTPITNLKLYQGLMEVHPENMVADLAVLRRETDRLNHIIEDLLRLSRIDQGRIELNLTTVDVNALTRQYVADRQPLAEAKGLELVFAGQPDLPPVEGDEGLLGQALSILLTNALSYTPKGGEVAVSTQRKSLRQKQWVGFSVSDNGPGITLEEQSQLFQRFFRGKAGRASNTSGTGLGLAIVNEIVQRHQGRIDVESEGVPGKGATFSVWLPATEQAT